MQSELKIGCDYLYEGATVALKAISCDSALVSWKGSTKLTPVPLEMLQPMPAANELLHPSMEIEPEDWHTAQRLISEFEAIDNLPRDGGRGEAMRRVAERMGLSTRQIYRLQSKYRAGPSLLELLPTRPGSKFGDRRLLAEVEKIISAAIEKEYLRSEKPPLAELVRTVETSCRENGLRPPSRNSIRKRVDAIQLRRRLEAREGKKHARDKCAPALDAVLAERPLQRIEVDHTLADVMLVADSPAREFLGRPWITFAIDVFTRMIVGVHVGYEPPSSSRVAMCMANAMLPKNAFLEMCAVQGAWPCQGKFEEIWVDNALEFRAEALKRGCQQHGSKLLYRPAATPHIGATVERLIGTMMGRVHLLPGTTQSNPSMRGDYKPDVKSCMTLVEFTKVLVEQIVNQYHMKLHKGIGMSPMSAWNEAFAGKEAPVFKASAMEALAAFLPAESRLLRRTGVEFKGAFYRNDRFEEFIGGKHRVVVHYHSLDASSVYVRLPSGELVVARHDGGVPRDGLAFADVKRRAQANQEAARDPAVAQKVDESRRNVAAAITAAQEKTTAARSEDAEPAQGFDLPRKRPRAPSILTPRLVGSMTTRRIAA